jgi:glucokinase
VKIASALPDAAVLLRELNAFRVTRGEGGHLSYGGKTEHDDLVLAVALSLMGCPSSEYLRHGGVFRNGGSGSSGVQFKQQI